MSAVKAPQRGPGRPRKPGAPRSAAQARLAEVIETAEQARDEAAEKYSGDSSVAAELELLSAELGVASAWAAYMRSEGNHTHAIKYGEDRTKTSGRIAALRELLVRDSLDELEARKAREDAAGKMVGS